MKVPTETFLRNVAEGKVYYFSSSRIQTAVAHYFICVKRTPQDFLILSCCTSQFETIERFVESRRLPNETLVAINEHDENNPFTKPTFINCNEYFLYTLEEFRKKYESETIDFSGEISEISYEEIVRSILASPLIEQEIKEELPDPDEL